MKENVARRPRFRRVLEFPKMRLTDRDKAILLAVSRYRFLTTSHFFSFVAGSRQNIARRLQRLYHAEFLDRPKAQLPLRYAGELSELVYSPTRKTHSHVAAEAGETDSGKECKSVSALFLAHSLSISDALISLERICRLRGTSFIPERDILAALAAKGTRHLGWRVTVREGADTETVGVVPDAAFAVERTDQSGGTRRWYFFLEVDRGTMPLHRKSLRQSSIHRKVLAYSKSRTSSVLKDKYGIPGFQVIFIARSRQRLEHIKEMCASASNGRGSSLFLFSTQDELRNGESPIAHQ